MKNWMKGSLLLCFAVLVACGPSAPQKEAVQPEVYESPMGRADAQGEKDEKVDTPEEKKDFNYLPTQKLGDALLEHRYYTVSYSSRHKNAEWVAYELSAARIAKEDVPRKHSFRNDPGFDGTASSKMYSRSGYDRGHLAPAHDMNFDKQAMKESFFMSNVSPQVPAFNRGIWKELEGKVRDWAEKDGHLYIVTGPILRHRIAAGTERVGGEEGPTVPRGFYKVILDYTGPEKKGIAFMFKNKDIDKALSEFAVPISEVERYTKLNFFPLLNGNEEVELEQAINLEKWGI